MLGFIVLRLTGPTHGFPEVVTEAQKEDKAGLESLCEEAWALASLPPLPPSFLGSPGRSGSRGLWPEFKTPGQLEHGRASVTKTEMATQCPPEKCSGGISSRFFRFHYKGSGVLWLLANT